jgi:tetratricopeptide (TPR) repeat protein
VYDELLDYATGSQKTPGTNIILGSAGYGVTTLLMTLATKLVEERAGAIFMLKPGCNVLEGDIEYASSLFPDRPFFFVDNAADHSVPLKSVIHRLRDTKRPAMFVLGERLNEWRQCSLKLSGKEFEIEPLSDPEIYRLIDCLAKHSELNKLEPLSKDLQFTAIKKVHRKELLVALRESTEGRGFDAIIEDEFRGIGDQLSRQLYLTVCGFYQHGAYVRDALLAQLLDISLPELYEETKDATEGVVIYDCIDESKGSFAARARHRTIAVIVWERCGELAEQERLLQLAIEALNLNYSADKNAFEQFVRSDRIVDSIRTLDGRIHFFETACRKDPESPYVRQHYARMLSRAGKLELSLGQIDEALKINPDILVLHHTKGIILMELGLTIDSIDIARRRLAQSEASFRRALSIYARDEYSYQGLARLYLGWAKRAPTPEEATEYISKAEGIISEGLRTVRIRDGLWIESSNIQAFLGNKPSHLKALETAVKTSPGSIIARYLLGKYYRKACRYQEALDVLYPVIKDHPEEFRSFVEYSVSLVHLNRPYREATSILNLSTLYGLSDPRFIATLGGMYFMDGSFSDAKNVFKKSSKREFTASELNTIQFYPPDPGNTNNRLHIKGKVIVVKAGYAMIESPGYPAFLCPGSKFGGVVMEPGLKVTFEPAFTPKGPVAIRPKIDV